MKHKLFALFAVLISATTISAQTNVSTDQELRDAIADKANIKLTSDIDLSNGTLTGGWGGSITGNTSNDAEDPKGGGGIMYRGGATYNISGQKVTKDYKGIVIKNGIKVVIK